MTGDPTPQESGRHDDRRPPARRSVAVVLGAGGVAGAAYHAGMLAAVAEATGWDPRTADLVVGTSAGASTAASLRAGLSAPDHLARVTRQPLSEAGTQLLGPVTEPLTLDDLDAGDPLDDPTPGRTWWSPATRLLPQAPWLVGPAFLRPGPARWGVALSGLIPVGTVSTAPIGDRIRAIATGRWPEDPTWIVAYRTADGRRVVFGRDDIEVPDLATAVEASSAVPGRFRPIRLDSGRYLDGAVYSPTNADLVANLGFDLVVISAPMAATEDALGSRPTLASRPRAWFARLLADEVAAVRRRGASVLVVQPGPAELLAIQAELSDRELGPLVAETAHQEVLAQLADPELASTLALLSRSDA
jgi:NTE family protein